MQDELRSNLSCVARAAAVFAAAAVAAGAVFYTVLAEIRIHRNIDEGGLVESTQLALLGLAAVAFAVRALRDREMSRAFALAALAVLGMCVREMDGYFDAWTGDHSFWAYVDAAVLAAMAAVVLRRFGRTADHVARFVRTPSCLLFVAGVVFAVVVAQLIGYKEIWNNIFDVEIWQEAKAAHADPDGHLSVEFNIARHVKNTVEESLELASYLMILGSAVLPPLLPRARGGDRG
ncbi:MAG: hypothetical protein IJV65_02810 [Kiritimatiellae bacterium]|nr:hypothetical protein [Kiritimatiellia bacterium]